MALKGFGYGCKTAEQVAQLKKLNLDWFYTWNDTPNLATPQPGVPEFVPMVWSDNPVRLDRLHDSMNKLNPRARTLLGFNEPDHEGQADMSTGDARRAWPDLQSTGLRLGSPATVNPGAWWMNRFMTDALAEGLRIDFVACHIYQNPHAGTFFRKVDELHERWGRPVWVTETAVADWDATTYGTNRYSRTEINWYMREIFEGAKSRPWLERIAWKTRASTDPQMGTSALFHTDGRLTTTGETYANTI